MRWVNSRLAAVLGLCLGLCACGDYSTEDLRFLAAVPSREDLRVEVPAEAAVAAGASAQVAACPTRPADTWLRAKPQSDQLNAAVEFLLGLVDVVRRQPPDWRAEDARGWGPFPDARHPGREIRVTIVRQYPDGPEGPPAFFYAFDARVAAGDGAWTTVLAGSFAGASASRGTGTLGLDFDALWTLGMADADTPRGRMGVEYDRSGTPVTIGLLLEQDGFGLAQFGYQFEGQPDGSGRFTYAFRNADGDLLVVTASFDAASAGRAAVGFRTALGITGGFRECWDPTACLVYVDDPVAFSCGGSAPCSFGEVSACPAVPSPPF